MPSQEKTSASTFWDGKLSEYAQIIMSPSLPDISLQERLERASQSLTEAGILCSINVSQHSNLEAADFKIMNAPSPEILDYLQNNSKRQRTFIESDISSFILKTPDLKEKRLIALGDIGDKANLIKTLTKTHRVAVLADFIPADEHCKDTIANAIKAGACVINQQFALNQLSRMKHEL